MKTEMPRGPVSALADNCGIIYVCIKLVNSASIEAQVQKYLGLANCG
jgi:hypothetical protein